MVEPCINCLGIEYKRQENTIPIFNEVRPVYLGDNRASVTLTLATRILYD